MDNFEGKINELELRIRNLADRLDLTAMKKEIVILEEQTELPDFWQDREKAAKTGQKLADLKDQVSEIQEMEKKVSDLKGLAKVIPDDDKELLKELADAEQRMNRIESQIFFGGKYDRGNAILSIFSGAGGQDAQDWTTMLLRMYEKFCQKRGFQTKILEQSFGEAGGPESRIGIKSVTLEVNGKDAFGLLKKENGVHRLVRLSPFSAKQLRHTSFALVEVLPEISSAEEEGIQIRPDDLRIDFYHSSGAGGQNVNKRMTAVRITHLPTKLVVSCQSERSQAMNRSNAMKVLLAKLLRLKEEQKAKEINEIKGDKISASWSNQIRNYVIHPYKMVKDLRTDVETSNVEAVLDGDLDQFINAEIKLAS